jgi:hypothetical protein
MGVMEFLLRAITRRAARAIKASVVIKFLITTKGLH